MSTTEERLEELLGQVLALPEADHEEALAASCAAHPDDAEELRRRFAALQHLGFAGVSAARTLGPGMQLGRYRLLEELGKGGMGVVYLAEQTDLGRKVALKLLRPGLLDLDRARDRFRREIEAATRLEHPGICPLYEAGEIDGVPFLAMRHVPGCTLAEHLDDLRTAARPPDPPTMVALVEKVARALGAAHDAGLVHRDVKPGNIQLADGGEPILLDFGLARAIEGEGPSLTVTGDVLGTPAYLAPEQIDGKHPIGPWTDVYALGAVLYECLTLRLPFEARSRESLYRAILTQEPAKASTVNHSVPADLQVVLEVALDKEPQRRYATATALAEDLARVRRREPIRARRISRWLRVRRWCQRNPYAATAMCVLAAGLVATLLLAGSMKSALAESEAKGHANLAWRLLDQDPLFALGQALEAVESQPDSLENLAALRAAIHRPQPVAVCDPGEACMQGFGFAPDRKSAAWLTMGGNLHVLRNGQFRDLGKVQNAGAVDLRFSPTGEEFLVSSVRDMKARAYSTEGQELSTLECDEGRPVAVDWHPVRDLAVVGWFYPAANPQRMRIRLYDTRSWESTVELTDDEEPIHGPMVRSVRFSADGNFVVAANAWNDAITNLPQQYKTRVWDTKGEFLFRHSEHDRNVYSMAVEGDLLVTGGWDRKIVLTDLRAKHSVARELHSAVFSVGFLPDGAVWAAGWDGYVQLFDRSLEPIQPVGGFSPAQGQIVNSVVPIGDLLLVSMRDVGRFLVDRDGKEITRLPGLPSHSMLGYCHDGLVGDRLVTYGYGEPARLWDWIAPGLDRFAWPDLVQVKLNESGQGYLTITRHGEAAVRDGEGRQVWSAPGIELPETVECAVSADLRTAVVCKDPGKVRVFDTSSGEEQLIEAGIVPFFRVNVGPRDRWILTWNASWYWFPIHRGDNGRWAVQPRLPQSNRIAAPFCFRPGAASDAIEVASGGIGCELYRYSKSGEKFAKRRKLVDPREGSTFPAFSHDGRWLAVGLENTGVVRIFDLDSSDDTPIREIAHGYGLGHLSMWSGDRLLTTSRDEVRLWSLDGTCLALLRSPRNAGFREAVLSENGDRIITLYQDLVVETWFAENADVIAAAQEILARLDK